MKKKRSLLLVLGLALMVVIAPGSCNPAPEVSRDIGASFPKGKVQIDYVSFEPVITRSQAISIAKKTAGFKADTLPTGATVAIFSGEVQQPGMPTVTDRKAWIVVIPAPYSSTGPPGSHTGTSQLNVAIDSTTGEVLHSVVSGKLQ